jgi:hypothetical protein
VETTTSTRAGRRSREPEAGRVSATCQAAVLNEGA